MSLYFGLPEEFSELFEKSLEAANREYERKSKAAYRIGIHAFGYETLPLSEREEQRVQMLVQAALEFFGALLFFAIGAFRKLETSDQELESRVTPALAAIRQIIWDRRWPKPMPLSPDWEERAELEFDHALIQWLEEQEEWRNYETQVVPHIAVPAVDQPSGGAAPSPVAYFQTWPLEKLSAAAKRRVKAGLLEIHGQFLDRKVKDDVECWRLAFDLIAGEFERARSLSEELVSDRIPEMVADAAAGGRWSRERMGRPQPTGIFSVRCGSQFYPRWHRDQFLEALRGRVTRWSGQLLVDRCATKHVPLLSKQALPLGSSQKKPSNALEAHRRGILKAAIRVKELDGMDALARHLGVSDTALQGMVRSDRTRYSDSRLASVLKQLGCLRAKWNRVPKSADRT